MLIWLLSDTTCHALGVVCSYDHVLEAYSAEWLGRGSLTASPSDRIMALLLDSELVLVKVSYCKNKANLWAPKLSHDSQHHLLSPEVVSLFWCWLYPSWTEARAMVCDTEERISSKSSCWMMVCCWGSLQEYGWGVTYGNRGDSKTHTSPNPTLLTLENLVHTEKDIRCPLTSCNVEKTFSLFFLLSLLEFEC